MTIINLSFLILILATQGYAASPAPAKKKKLSLQDLIASTQPSPKPTAVAGVRGLDETGTSLDTQARDFPAIEKLEQMVIHDDELATFMTEGKLR